MRGKSGSHTDRCRYRPRLERQDIRYLIVIKSENARFHTVQISHQRDVLAPVAKAHTGNQVCTTSVI